VAAAQACGKGAGRDDKAESSSKAQQKLSREYIAQRADVDEPIQGLVVRTRQHDWMQGFVWWTPFTTWTHFFRWDSLATQCGMRRGPVRVTTSSPPPPPPRQARRSPRHGMHSQQSCLLSSLPREGGDLLEAGRAHLGWKMDGLGVGRGAIVF